MSQEGMKKFSELIAKDAEVAEKVKAAGADIDGLVKLAADHGCEITTKDFHALAADIHNKLSEEDLESVVGGGFLSSVTNAVSSAASAVNFVQATYTLASLASAATTGGGPASIVAASVKAAPTSLLEI